MTGEKKVQFGGETVASDEKTALYNKNITTASDTDLPPSAARRQTLARALGTRGPACGIKNLGATCYMNSLLQSLFTTTELRNHILTWNFDPKQRHAQNIAYQLQLLFYQMTHPQRPFVDAKALVDSFGMGSGAYHQQHDVQELNRKLLDVVQTFIDRAGAPQVLRSLYEGKFRDYKKCTTCKFEAYSYSTFQDISVNIEGIPTLEGAIAAFTNPDFIDGVTCDECRQPREVAKGLTYEMLPRIFTIQLLRMQYNFETGRREKVHQDVKLPLTLDCTQYDRKGMFELHSVIAHRGTAYHGHYYTYTRIEKNVALTGDEKPFTATAADVGGRWVKFDDDTVSWIDPTEVEEYIDPAQWKARSIARDEADLSAKSVPHISSEGQSGVAAAPPSSDNDEDAVANLFIDPSAPKAKPLKTVSGHSYYAVYRRVDLPWPNVTVDPLPPNIPAYVPEAVQDITTTFEKETAELAELAQFVPVGLVYQGVKRWVDCLSDTAVGTLTHMALHLFENEESLKFARLRSYSSSLGVLGATHDASATLASLGYDAANLKSYPVFGLEITDMSDIGCSWANQHITEWDVKLNLHQYQPQDDTFVDLNPTKSEWRPEFTFHADATVNDVYAAAAQRIGEDNPALLFLSIVRKSVAEPLEFSAETGAPIEIAVTKWRDVPGALETDRVLVEYKAHRPTEPPSDVNITKPWLLSRATIFTERKHQAVITAKFFGSHLPVATSGEPSEEKDGESTASALIVLPDREIFFKMDERKSLTDLKVKLCQEFGVSFNEVQLLVDGARREPPTLSSTIRQASFATKKLSVVVVTGAPLASDETYVEVYRATGDYIKPVAFFDKFLLRVGKTTKDELVAAVLKRSDYRTLGLPTDPSLLRVRLMQPQRSSSLGVPLLKDIVTENTASHHVDELRLVLQPLERPDEAFTKSSLILNLHHWDSTVPSSREALGRRHEFVTAKDAPTSDLTRKIAQLLGVDFEAAATIAEAADDTLPPFEFAKCRAFQLTDHQTVAKLPWGLIDVALSSPDAAKHLGGFPLRLEQEDIIVFRKPTDPWPAGVVQQFGEVIGGKTVVSKKRNKAAAKGAVATGKKGADKTRRDEPGIHLKAVWEMENETIVEGPSSSSAPAPATATEADPSALPQGRGVPVDFLPSCNYTKDQHASLEEACNVCLGEFEDGEEVCILHCYHVFHKDCLAPWTLEKGTCPKCLVSVLQ